MKKTCKCTKQRNPKRKMPDRPFFWSTRKKKHLNHSQYPTRHLVLFLLVNYFVEQVLRTYLLQKQPTFLSVIKSQKHFFCHTRDNYSNMFFYRDKKSGRVSLIREQMFGRVAVDLSCCMPRWFITGSCHGKILHHAKEEKEEKHKYFQIWGSLSV